VAVRHRGDVPLKINLFRIRNGSAPTSTPAGPAADPARAQRGRAEHPHVKSEKDEYPSPVTLDAIVFDDGRLAVDGHCDFLREPYAR